MFLEFPGDVRLSVDEFADMVADKIVAKQAAPALPHISLKEAQAELDCTRSTLWRRLKAAGVRTYWRGSGKAFDRKHLSKLS